MIDLLMAFLFVTFGSLFAWISGLLLVFYLAFYVITLIVDALSPAELKPD